MEDAKPIFDDSWREVINGENTFTFSLKAEHGKEILEGYFITFIDDEGHRQLFEIEEIEGRHDESNITNFSCKHAFYELQDEFAPDMRPRRMSAGFFLNHILQDSRFEPGTVHSLGSETMHTIDQSAQQALHENLIDVLGGERRARIAMTGQQITGRYIDLLQRRGSDTGKRIRFGKDARGITRTIDMDNVKTLLRGRGRGEETEDGFGRRLTFAGIEWSTGSRIKASFEQSNISMSTGEDFETNHVNENFGIRSPYFLPHQNETLTFHFDDSEYRVGVWFYDEEKEFREFAGYRTSSPAAVQTGQSGYYRFSLTKQQDGGVIRPGDEDDAGFEIQRSVTRNPINKPLGQDYVEDNDALQQFGRKNSNGSRRHRKGTFEMSDADDPTDLLQGTLDALENAVKPNVTYVVDYIDTYELESDQEDNPYQHERLLLGDTVIIHDDEFVPPLLLEARLTERDKSFTNPENSRGVLSNFIDLHEDDRRLRRIESTLNSKEGVWDDKIPKFVENTQWLEGKINALQNQLIASGAYQQAEVIPNQGFMLENTDAQSEDFGALYLGPGIFALASEQHSNGEWNWRTFGTGKGFTADEINAGRIRTALVEIYGSTNFYWDGDDLWAIDPSDSERYARLRAGELYIKKGAITIERPDGFKVVDDGMLTYDVSVQSADPPLTGPGVQFNDSGYWYTTETDRSQTCQYYSFEHKARYLNFRCFLYVDSGTTAHVTIETGVHSNNDVEVLASATSTNTDASTPSNPDNDPRVRELTVDLGVPDGEQKSVYLRIRSSNGGRAHVRTTRRWLNG
ncbi:phage tail spike protein [Alkalicoccus luteus]|uniref:Tail spike domain-containing protein n=1 Tax=Alkalicoccus luteus TaxID=1237094 RepID=A0A969PRQ9_9BACI|nr:phage tail spike protein [Alkalicoccus luteus]NJP37201.1 hypothetical protein [Alkalicoccus luteus]